MLTVFLALMLSCLAQACNSLPAFSPPEPPDPPDVLVNVDTIVIPVSYGLWYSDSNVLVSVNAVEMTLAARSANFVIPSPADGNVTITGSNPLGMSCSPPGTIKLADAERGVIIPCAAMLRLSTQQPATYTIGQADMNSAALITPPNSGDMNVPWGLAAQNSSDSNVLLVADEYYNRVLAFALPISGNNPNAKFVLGQGGAFNGAANAASQSTLSQPLSLNIADGTLVVADANNNRVLLFHTLPVDGTALPDTVVGQPSFTATATGCSANNLQFPMAALQAAGRLYVADTKNNRVLVWLTVPQSGVAPPPDAVIGQPSFITCTPAAPAANTLAGPRGLHWDGNYFFIADSSNHRILIYSTPPDGSTAPAFLVGQTGYDSQVSCDADTCLNLPKGVTSDTNTIYVLDTSNNRVLGYRRSVVFSSTIDAPPVPYMALGAASTNGASTATNASSTTLRSPSAATIVGSQLFVSDSYNYRILVYSSD